MYVLSVNLYANQFARCSEVITQSVNDKLRSNANPYLLDKVGLSTLVEMEDIQ